MRTVFLVVVATCSGPVTTPSHITGSVHDTGDTGDTAPVVVTSNTPPRAVPVVTYDELDCKGRMVPGGTFALDGAGSTDLDGDPLTYAWSVVEAPLGSTVGIANPTAAQTTATQDLPGRYAFQLTVDDGQATDDHDRGLEILHHDRPPVAHAGPDQAATVGHTVALDGTGSSDPDGDALAWRWRILARPPGSAVALSAASVPEIASTPYFVPDAPGIYTFELTVSSDGCSDVDSQPDVITVTALAP